MSKTHKIKLTDEDLYKLKKHRTLRIGNNLLIVDKNRVNQVRVYGETTA